MLLYRVFYFYIVKQTVIVITMKLSAVFFTFIFYFIVSFVNVNAQEVNAQEVNAQENTSEISLVTLEEASELLSVSHQVASVSIYEWFTGNANTAMTGRDANALMTKKSQYLLLSKTSKSVSVRFIMKKANNYSNGMV
jgi:hypothetical protein